MYCPLRLMYLPHIPTPDVADCDAINSESRPDVADCDAINSEPRPDCRAGRGCPHPTVAFALALRHSAVSSCSDSR
jgi:hypothetical protein